MAGPESPPRTSTLRLRASMASAGIVFMTVRASAPAASAAGSDALRHGGRGGGEAQPAALNVGAREVQLDGGDPAVFGEPLAESVELLRALARYRDDDGQTEVECIEFSHKELDARVLESDGVDHPGRGLRDARGW